MSMSRDKGKKGKTPTKKGKSKDRAYGGDSDDDYGAQHDIKGKLGKRMSKMMKDGKKKKDSILDDDTMSPLLPAIAK